MKTINSFFVLLSMLCLVACGAKNEEVVQRQPGEVALLFFNSIISGDVDNVRDNVYFEDPAEQAIFDEYLERLFIPQIGKMPRENNAGYVVVAEEVLGDTAFVELKGMTIADKTAKMKIRLLNSDGWKVDGAQAVLHRVE